MLVPSVCDEEGFGSGAICDVSFFGHDLVVDLCQTRTGCISSSRSRQDHAIDVWRKFGNAFRHFNVVDD